MFHAVTDGDAETVDHDLSQDKEGRSEQNVADRPAIVECPDDEDELEDDVDDCASQVEDEVDYP